MSRGQDKVLCEKDRMKVTMCKKMGVFPKILVLLEWLMSWMRRDFGELYK